MALQQGGLGLILTVLIVTAPPWPLPSSRACWAHSRHIRPSAATAVPVHRVTDAGVAATATRRGMGVILEGCSRCHRREQITQVGALALMPIVLGATIKQRRSEEHTSALQSLMRISYAVFCLK